MTAQTALPVQALRNSVRLADPYTLAALRSTDQVLLGLANGDQPVTLPSRIEHLLVTTGGGGGTTTVLRSVAAQALRLGAHVDILDVAGGRGPSHTWAPTLPNTTFLARTRDIHDHLIGLLDVLRQPRCDHASTWAQRRLVVIEHGERLVFALRHYWAHTRPDSQLPEAPGVEALGMLLAAGDACGIQFAVGSTSGVLPALGDLRVADVFPTRLLAYAGATLWQRVAPEVWPVPPYSVIPGRMHVVTDRAATCLQALHLTEVEARGLARGTTPKELR